MGVASVAMGESTKTGRDGMRPACSSSRSRKSTSWVRPMAKAGITMAPPARHRGEDLPLQRRGGRVGGMVRSP